MGMPPPAPPPGFGPPDRGPAPPPGIQDAPPGYRPYGHPGFGAFGSGQSDHPQGTTVLVLGVLSLVVCGLLGPIAWVMGSRALNEIDADPVRYRNRGTVLVGKVLGIVSTVLLLVTAFVWIAVISAIVGAV